MKSAVLAFDAGAEFWSDEGCYINELSNHAGDEAVSIARARVKPGVSTEPHRLEGVVERYVIVAGEGTVYVDGLPAAPVHAGDVVVIPAGASQRIKNAGSEDLVFLCVCTPRFQPRCYQRIEAS